MRTFDFAPFYRSTVGLTRCFQCSIKSAAWKACGAGLSSLQYQTFRRERLRHLCNIAGFTGADLSIEVKENTLTIRGNKQSSGEEAAT